MDATKPDWLLRVLEAVPIAAAAFDTTGRITAINRRAALLLGTRSDNSRPDIPQQIYRSVEMVLGGHKESEQGETQVGDAWLSYSVSSLSDEMGGTLAIVSLATSQPETTTNDLLLMAAHQFKTPLTAIKGGAQLLQRRALRSPSETSQRDAALLGMVAAQVDKLGEMVNSLLEASRLSSKRIHVSLEDCPLDEILQAAVEQYERRNLPPQVVLELPNEVPRARCDRERIAQVVQLLLLNAAEYSEPDSSITVQLVRQGEVAIVSVTDRGSGIPEPDQPRIFDRFYQGRNARGGLGLGLYVASELVKLHGGKLWLEETTSQGSTFRFTLPAGCA